jgi:hypothetical protein
VPRISVAEGPSNARALPGEPGGPPVPEPEPVAAAEPPGPTPGGGSTPRPSLPASSAPKAAKAAPSLTDKKDGK